MTPVAIALVLGTGLLALVPTIQLAKRTANRATVASYFVALWLAIAIVVSVPGMRRLAVPLAIVLAIAPWVNVRAGLDRMLGRRARRAPPRNVTPPEAGGPASP